ncbi:MAG: lysoplasmalogenase [Chitinophagales bacterium]
MKKMPLLLILYFLFGIVHLVALDHHNTDVDRITKYALMPLLMAYVFIQRKKELRSIATLCMALFFSWAGDAFLLYTANAEIYFTLGLGMFLLAHIFYILQFRKSMFKSVSAFSKRSWVFLPVILYSGLLLTLIIPGLGDMLVPVIIYALVITLMFIAAMDRFGRTNMLSYRLAFIGAALFILSDSMIAINTFYKPFNYASLAIMTTYIAAQFLIVQGILSHSDVRSGEEV